MAAEGDRNPLDRLAVLDACAVSDAMDALGLPPAVAGLRRLSGRGLLCGRAVTLQLAEGAAPEGAPKVHLGARAVAASDAESVIVVQHPGVEAGGWGGVLSNAAQAAGVRGVIVDGPTRDVDEAAALGFPVFARRATARTARGRVHEVSTGATVRVEGVAVTTGDYVIADGSGVVFIPAAQIEAVLARAEDIARREARMTEQVRAGRPVTQVLGADYETMLDKDG